MRGTTPFYVRVLVSCGNHDRNVFGDCVSDRFLHIGAMSQRKAKTEIDDVRPVVRSVSNACADIGRASRSVIIQYAHGHNFDVHPRRTIRDNSRDMGSMPETVLRNIVPVDTVMAGNQTSFQKRVFKVYSRIHYGDHHRVVDSPALKIFRVFRKASSSRAP